MLELPSLKKKFDWKINRTSHLTIISLSVFSSLSFKLLLNGMKCMDILCLWKMVENN